MQPVHYRQNVPLFLPLAALAGGIITGRVLPLWPAMVLPIAGLIIVALLRRHYAMLLAVIMEAGVVLAVAASPKQLPAQLEGAERVYSGIITERTDNDRSTTAIVEIDSIGRTAAMMNATSRFRARISFFDSFLWLQAGRRVIFHTSLAGTSHAPQLPDDPDLSGYYLYKRISATGVVFAGDVSATGTDSKMLTALHCLRQRISDKLHRSGVSEECAAFLDALLLGDETRLDAEFREEMTVAGLSHIIALSGTHVAIIALLVSALLFPLYLLGYRTAAMTISIAALFSYALLTGLSASVVRSVTMASAVIVAVLSDRKVNSLNSLCFAAIVILCFRPLDIYSPGMQMSFAAVASILLLANAFNPINQRHRVIYNTVGIVTTIIAAVAGTWIIACHYFHYTSLWFLPVNIPLVILLPVEITGAALLIMVDTLGLNMPFVAATVDGAYELITWMAESVGEMRVTGLRDVFINPWCIPVYFLALYIFSQALRTRATHLHALAASVMLAACAVAHLPHGDNITPGRWYITRNNSWTDVVAHNAHGISVATSAWRETAEETRLRFSTSHRDFLSRRKIDAPKVMRTDASNDRRQRQLMLFGETTIAIAGAPSDTCRLAPLPHSHYTIVTRNSQTMHADRLRHHYHPDTVIIANEVYPSHHDRLIAELTEISQPFISLRNCKNIFSREL